MGKKIAVIHTSLAIRERLDEEIMRQIQERRFIISLTREFYRML